MAPPERPWRWFGRGSGGLEPLRQLGWLWGSSPLPGPGTRCWLGMHSSLPSASDCLFIASYFFFPRCLYNYIMCFMVMSCIFLFPILIVSCQVYAQPLLRKVWVLCYSFSMGEDTRHSLMVSTCITIHCFLITIVRPLDVYASPAPNEFETFRPDVALFVFHVCQQAIPQSPLLTLLQVQMYVILCEGIT